LWTKVSRALRLLGLGPGLPVSCWLPTTVAWSARTRPRRRGCRFGCSGRGDRGLAAVGGRGGVGGLAGQQHRPVEAQVDGAGLGGPAADEAEVAARGRGGGPGRRTGGGSAGGLGRGGRGRGAAAGGVGLGGGRACRTRRRRAWPPPGWRARPGPGVWLASSWCAPLCVASQAVVAPDRSMIVTAG
jgi:hypothetical protein